MKKYICAAFLIVFAAYRLAASGEPQVTSDELGDIRRLEIILDGGGILQLPSSGIPCPLIHSGYFVECSFALGPNWVKIEQSKREFGLKLAKTLAFEGEKLQKKVESSERMAQANQLLRLSEWIGTTKGYGNYFLCSRCESLAAVPLAYLAADIGFPQDQVLAFEARFMRDGPEKDFRLNVLNEEARRPVFDSSDEAHMEASWNKGWRAMKQWFSDRSIPLSAWTRGPLPVELAFFLDDENTPEIRTLESLWNMKRHNSVVYGVRDVQLRAVRQLIVFRKTVGKFPTVPANTNNTFGKSLIEAAFEEAWLPYWQKGAPLIYQGAARAFQQVNEGRFFDEETYQTKHLQPIPHEPTNAR